MTPAEKQKEIAVTFTKYYINDAVHHYDRASSYDSWLLTEEGKRLTVEEPEPEFDRFLVCGPKKKRPLNLSTVGEKIHHRADDGSIKPGKRQVEESSYDLLVKISGQLDQIEGNMKFKGETNDR